MADNTGVLEPTEIVFELNDVSYSYLNEPPVLKNINLKVHRGEQIVILGANGSGKSTLQKILDGLIFPTAGTVKAFGCDLSEENLNDRQFSRNFRQRVGFIFQNSDAQLFSPNVWEEIAFGPLQLDLPKGGVEARVNSIIEALGLQTLKDRPPYKLSGGEKKKVAIASVLAINPEVLVLDEPTNGLDPRTQMWLVEVLIKLHQAGKTIITATHNLDIVKDIADRVIVLNEEHVIAAEGNSETILRDRELL
ncbi:MAG: energy-coupling factor ABC transporter ATP-binding protein, partial [Eubacteriales bacterium]